MSESEQDAVDAVIASVSNDARREDAVDLLELMREVTGEHPKVWNHNTIGFGEYHYRYASGTEGEFFTVGFSPRAQNLTLYIMSGLRGFDDILERLGPHTSSKSCVYIKRLGAVDREALRDLIAECVSHVETAERTMGAVPRMSEIPPRKAT